jgi:drug/metabolite transporter (DMT)-like permease
MRLALLVTLAILAFAGNSLLTRAGLAAGLMGAASFAAIRLLAGAGLLAALAAWRGGRVRPTRADVKGIAALAVYMLAFTFAYLELAAATGALILFASVQLTIVAASLLAGQKPTLLEALGGVLALGGLAWLLLDDVRTPQAVPALSMVVAGAAWGVYTLVGRGATDALAMTARNFVGAAPIGVAAWWLAPAATAQPAGVLFAVISGAVTSGIGYAIWYAALPRLSRMTAGVAMLLVPPVTAAAAAVGLGEPITTRLVVASVLVLGGVLLTIVGRRA